MVSLNMAKTFKSELRKVLNYLEEDEEKHFAMEGGDDHIIHSIRFLREHQRKWRNPEYRKWRITIPRPETIDGFEGVPAGEYDMNGVVNLLRENKDNPEAIQFIADMMEH